MCAKLSETDIYNGSLTWGLLVKIHKNQLFKNLCLRMRVSPGAIHIQPLRGWRFIYLYPRFHLGLFIFNPYGVGAIHY